MCQKVWHKSVPPLGLSWNILNIHFAQLIALFVYISHLFYTSHDDTDVTHLCLSLHIKMLHITRYRHHLLVYYFTKESHIKRYDTDYTSNDTDITLTCVLLKRMLHIKRYRHHTYLCTTLQKNATHLLYKRMLHIKRYRHHTYLCTTLQKNATHQTILHYFTKECYTANDTDITPTCVLLYKRMLHIKRYRHHTYLCTTLQKNATYHTIPTPHLLDYFTKECYTSRYRHHTYLCTTLQKNATYHTIPTPHLLVYYFTKECYTSNDTDITLVYYFTKECYT